MDVRNSTTFTSDTEAAFQQHLLDKPNNRRLSTAEKDQIIQWLTSSNRTGSCSQREFSRRNYAKKLFKWDVEAEELLALPKKSEQSLRKVVTTDDIIRIVKDTHVGNGHGGWDATWKNVSTSYYGILREDVIFLLKRCQICAQDPRKRPKGPPSNMPDALEKEEIALHFPGTESLDFFFGGESFPNVEPTSESQHYAGWEFFANKRPSPDQGGDDQAEG